MKVILAFGLLAVIAIVYSERCQQASDCTSTACVDANATITCMHGECTCPDGGNNGGNNGGTINGTPCQGNADCHHHHAAHCVHGQHAVCMNSVCQCVQH